MSFQSAEGSPLITGFGNTPTLAGANQFTGANSFTSPLSVLTLVPGEIVDSTNNTGANGYVLSITGGAGALLWAPPAGGGGDVTLAGDNAFAGSNSFLQAIIANGGMDAAAAPVTCGATTCTTLRTNGMLTCSAGINSVTGVSTFGATTTGQLSPTSIRDVAGSVGAAGYLLSAGAGGSVDWIASPVGNLGTANDWTALNTFSDGINIPDVFNAIVGSGAVEFGAPIVPAGPYDPVTGTAVPGSIGSILHFHSNGAISGPINTVVNMLITPNPVPAGVYTTDYFSVSSTGLATSSASFNVCISATTANFTAIGNSATQSFTAYTANGEWSELLENNLSCVISLAAPTTLYMVGEAQGTQQATIDSVSWNLTRIA